MLILCKQTSAQTDNQMDTTNDEQKIITFQIRNVQVNNHENYSEDLFWQNCQIEISSQVGGKCLMLTSEDGTRTYHVKSSQKIFNFISTIMIIDKDQSEISITFKNPEDCNKCCEFLLEKHAIQKDTDWSTDIYTSLERSFRQEFNDPLNVLKKFENHIEKTLTDFYSKAIFSPIVLICQSSGHGKSKLMLEYSKKHIGTYLNLRDPDHNGFPKSSNIRYQLFEHIKQNTTEIFLVAYLITILKHVNSILAQIDEKTEAAMAAKFVQCQPWFKNSNYLKYNDEKENEMKAFDIELEANIKYMANSTSPIKTELAKLKQQWPTREDNKYYPIAIILDEANVLTKEKFQDETYFIHFRRAINRILVNDLELQVVCVMADTASTISQYSVSTKEYSNSQRISQLKSSPPICYVFFIEQVNCFIDTYLKTLENLKPQSYYHFVQTRNAQDGLFLLGRPLWISIKNSGQDIVRMAQEKLIRRFLDSKISSSNYESLAILGSRTTLFSNFMVPNTTVASILVKSYMATLYDIAPDGESLYLRYISEPILAEAAARLMTTDNKFSLANIVTSFLESISSSKQETGELGELAAELILLHAKDKATKDMDHSKAISVKQFLCALVGENNFNEFISIGISRTFKSGLVSFTHFSQMIEPSHTRLDTIMNQIGRCAAGRFVKGFHIVDYFIPVVLFDGRISFIFIQVKNYADNNNQRVYFQNELDLMTPTDIMTKCTTDKSGKISTISYSDIDFVNGVKSDYLSLLMSVGTTTPSTKFNIRPSKAMNHVALYGINPSVYACLDDESSKKLQNLVKISRIPYCQEESREFISLYTKGVTKFTKPPKN